MKYAFVSDIHGNIQAWTQVWASLTVEQVDGVICLGDIVGYGPRPAETLASVRSKVNFCVIGNHDAVIAGQEDPSRFNKEAQEIIRWSAQELDEEAIRYFSQLPYEINLDTEHEVIRCVHGSPYEPEIFWYVSNAREARLAWDSTDAQITFIGHSHVPGFFTLNQDNTVKYREGNNLLYQIEEGKRYIINAGSVGLSRDGDRRAAYCIYDSEKRNFYWRRIDFDLEKFRRDVKNRMPDKKMAAFVLDNFELSVETQAIKKFTDFNKPTDETQRLTIDRKTGIKVQTINARKNFIKRRKTGSTQNLLPIKKGKRSNPAKTQLIIFLIAAAILGFIVALIFFIGNMTQPKSRNGNPSVPKQTPHTTPDGATKNHPPAVSVTNLPLIRYIRLDHKKNGIFNLAEIEAYKDGRNIAWGKKVTSKSPGAYGTDIMNLVDGNKNGSFNAGGFYNSPPKGNNEWILLDLGKATSLDSIKIYNRTDTVSDCNKRIIGATISLLNAKGKKIGSPFKIKTLMDVYNLKFGRISTETNQNKKKPPSNNTNRDIRTSL